MGTQMRCLISREDIGRRVRNWPRKSAGITGAVTW